VALQKLHLPLNPLFSIALPRTVRNLTALSKKISLTKRGKKRTVLYAVTKIEVFKDSTE
jgi:hypothetical protein